VETPAPFAWTVMVTTTGEGDDGDGPEPPPPPPPQEDVARKSDPILSKIAIEAPRCGVRRHFIASADPTDSVMSQRVTNRPGGFGHGAGACRGDAAGMELTCTVSVSEALPLAGSDGARGLKVHVVPLGRPEHRKFTVPVAPFCDLSVMANFADCPTVTVAEEGVMLLVKPGGACTTRVAEVDCVIGPAVPVMVKG